jgi:hypothetical protein
MDKQQLTAYFSRLDEKLSAPVRLYIYGSAVVILLDAPGRTSLDIDVAGPYTVADQSEFACLSESLGLPVNPDPLCQTEHVEWIGPLRLCLPMPRSEHPGMMLWQGRNLTVMTGTVEDLVASKLIRYDVTDRTDIQYLFSQYRFEMNAVQDAVSRLPHPFHKDAMVLQNIENLKADIMLWGGGGA